MAWNICGFISTPNGKVAYGCGGQGPALLLAHGWPWSSFTWSKVIPELVKNFTVYWFDMPGYGKSDMCERYPTSLDTQGETFALVLKHFRLHRPSVVAHDVGGAVALRAHLLQGCDYEFLILMNVVAVRPWGSAFFEHVKQHPAAFKGLPRHIHAALSQAYIDSALKTRISKKDREGLYSPWLTDEGQKSFYRQFEQADERYTADIENMYGQLKCPTGIIWGENDPWIPLERGLMLHRMIPNATFTTIKGAGHLPQMERPRSVTQSLLRHLHGAPLDH